MALQPVKVWPSSWRSGEDCADETALLVMTLTYPKTSNLREASSISTLLSSQVRSQSESAALNSISIKVPRNLLHDWEMCRQQMQSGRYGKVSFYAPAQEPIQSDSEGDDSLVSSEDGSSSSSAQEEHEENLRAVVAEEDDDLGVVRDLELDDHDDEHELHPHHLHHQDDVEFHLEVEHAEPPFRIELEFTPPSAQPTPDHESTCLAPPSTAEHESTVSSGGGDVVPGDGEEASTPSSPYLTPFGELKPTPSQQRLADLVSEQCSIRFEEEQERVRQQQQRKKCVRFADDCGQCLETVRVMTEPSDYPPKISSAVIRRYRKAAAAAAAALAGGSASGSNGSGSGSSASVEEDDEDDEEGDSHSRSAPRCAWKMGFKQPASEYVKFRETLEQKKVALENVMLKNEIGRMVGTIKVANVGFQKRVFMRYTSDGWRSFLDRPATYQSSPSKAFDTFRFDVELPRGGDKDSRVEFCVCYVVNEEDEYWDSNGGKNFQLISPHQDLPQPNALPQSASAYHRRHSLDTDDAYRFEYNDWTKFASWKQLSTQGPYW